ncbi:MAG TPA: hypothetical protein VHV32_18980 [Candidatus Angelobacter sp.]|jgi:ATP-dependent protease HslVU (ClpYQ) peptidase subunit|nr:hypothetical protein [Candidatus Angelobacter sp.]
MSIVVWDGRTLAADKRATNGSMVFTTTKIRLLERNSGDVLLGWTGEQDSGEMVAKWYADGAEPREWPDCQKDKDLWSRLIVVNKAGVWFYERQPLPVRVEDAYAAWGSGRDFALAALRLGKSAVEAVEIACHFDSGCGNGIDALTL